MPMISNKQRFKSQKKNYKSLQEQIKNQLEKIAGGGTGKKQPYLNKFI